ncbi:crotonase/enoyl-CoA hydratase family protein [Aurantimonas sp. Leaf443]|uniref:crotonase/enoyl-CoA hydratase family protein n=1 Tax=Aurantimonas sp. Leaf443 TaxID=1736378 RepID=UPI0006F222B9|nr:crotonase/enoyl-CoA hydratase family protein [Aurantimonas sp. Leaf443]KQT88052.1 enoyl-CoA hydratase [Aurantimonas sp. Leaf443]
MSEHVRVEAEAGILTIAMERPQKKNALTREMYAAMTQALQRADADAAIRAVVFTGVPGAFSSGNDIGDFAAIAAGGDLPAEVPLFLHALAGAEKPLIAAVDGLAIGIGTTLLLHCDLAYASPASQFRTPFLDLGLVPEAASSLIAPRIMGHQRAFALLVLGEAFTAEEAREAGLVHRVVDGGVTEAAMAAARKLSQRAPEALAIARGLVRGPREEITARIEEELTHFARRLRSPEAQAAFKAFLAR